VDDDGDITRLLRRWREGRTEVENELFRLVMPDLRNLARYFIRGERKGHSLQATELVDEIYFRLVAAKEMKCESDNLCLIRASASPSSKSKSFGSSPTLWMASKIWFRFHFSIRAGEEGIMT
jgi:hypothetical protein